MVNFHSYVSHYQRVSDIHICYVCYIPISGW